MAHALALGLMMSVGYRVKVLWLPRDDFKAMIDSKSFKIASAVQLNVNEWSPYFVAALLYLHTQGAGSNLVAWGSVFSLSLSASQSSSCSTASRLPSRPRLVTSRSQR